jgi:ACR3 family arsenite efflux pump ArsB
MGLFEPFLTVRVARSPMTMRRWAAEVPVMLSLVAIANRTRHWFPA